MRKILFLLGCCWISVCGLAQKPLYTISADSTSFQLTLEGASMLATLPLKCIEQEYPNKTSHTSASDSDHVLTPKQLHPAFYGCFDWHSCVHGHWMLIRLLKLFPQLPEATKIRAVLNRTINKPNIEQELRYLDLPLTRGWERTYGWAWLLKLRQELEGWNDKDGREWKQAIDPLVKKIVQQWIDYLPKQTYPNRTGVHPNTAFGLVFAFDYAEAVGDTVFKKAITRQAKRLYLDDVNAPTRWEPDGSDFLSPSLEEADLMRRILPIKKFVSWLGGFIKQKDFLHLTQLPIVSDRSDYQIVHLDGLCFSRSWCMKGIATVLPPGDKRKTLLLRAGIQHLASALPHVAGGNYGGEHWLASFAVYALAN